MRVKVCFFVNQLGSIKVHWLIPIDLVSNSNEVAISIPSFKYDLPKISTLPVPFSSKAIKIDLENVLVKHGEAEINYTVCENFEGKKNIVFECQSIDFSKGANFIDISYELKNIVNNDTIFYVIVYSLSNPFEQACTFEIDLKARFSFKIRKYKFREWYFDQKTGKKLKRNKVFEKLKTGDLIELRAENLLLDQETELDLHLTGSRMPFLMRRDLFWLSIFIFSIILILSPIWKALL